MDRLKLKFTFYYTWKFIIYYLNVLSVLIEFLYPYTYSFKSNNSKNY